MNTYIHNKVKVDIHGGGADATDEGAAWTRHFVVSTAPLRRGL